MLKLFLWISFGLVLAQQDNYLDVLKNGLPNCQLVGNCKTIGVVGCGASGLLAATLLKNAGHNVYLVEANSRCGGRIETYCDPITGSCIDVGAMRFPDAHELVSKEGFICLKEKLAPFC